MSLRKWSAGTGCLLALVGFGWLSASTIPAVGHAVPDAVGMNLRGGCARTLSLSCSPLSTNFNHCPDNGTVYTSPPAGMPRSGITAAYYTGAILSCNLSWNSPTSGNNGYCGLYDQNFQAGCQ
ncbi:MAG: hypothetical protein M3O30_08215 [Planctomycetota bacterium]|nr:hypothetical protein [Planctomycetota bacterium]